MKFALKNKTQVVCRLPPKPAMNSSSPSGTQSPPPHQGMEAISSLLESGMALSLILIEYGIVMLVQLWEQHSHRPGGFSSFQLFRSQLPIKALPGSEEVKQAREWAILVESRHVGNRPSPSSRETSRTTKLMRNHEKE